jgi:hypothetical protein
MYQFLYANIFDFDVNPHIRLELVSHAQYRLEIELILHLNKKQEDFTKIAIVALARRVPSILLDLLIPGEEYQEGEVRKSKWLNINCSTLSRKTSTFFYG